MSLVTTQLHPALERLHNSDVVAIPTETVYGLAADATNDVAIHKVFALKKRPLNHPLIMHVAPEWDLAQWTTHIPDYVQKLITQYWPGPLTIVLPINPGKINPLITGGQQSIAIRAPNHPLALELLRQFGKPLVAPSANLFGKVSPTTAAHVAQSFENQDVLVLDGGRCDVGIESTIILATDPHEFKILRHGIIDEIQLRNSIAVKLNHESSDIRSSGALKHHYQPEKPLYYVNYGASFEKIRTKHPEAYILHFSPLKNSEYNIQLPLDPIKVAHELYYQLRQADTSCATQIIIELPPNDLIWQALRDRILKASVTMLT
jgi:L-threonylcarbamoyladenylate synthase